MVSALCVMSSVVTIVACRCSIECFHQMLASPCCWDLPWLTEYHVLERGGIETASHLIIQPPSCATVLPCGCRVVQLSVDLVAAGQVLTLTCSPSNNRRGTSNGSNVPGLGVHPDASRVETPGPGCHAPGGKWEASFLHSPPSCTRLSVTLSSLHLIYWYPTGRVSIVLSYHSLCIA